jgi:hypothetical protein
MTNLELVLNMLAEANTGKAKTFQLSPIHQSM